MAIERNFRVSFVASQALREKQIQQNYRPVIAVHKWFARRPGTLFRGLTLAEFGDGPLEEAFYKANAFPGRVVADPFVGGGTPLLEANRVGCDVIGVDVNPMAVWVVREEIERVDLTAYQAAACRLLERLSSEINRYYQTACAHCGNDVPAKYLLWIKTHDCEQCGHTFDLFPGYLIAQDRRHPRNVLACAACGSLNEVSDVERPGSCVACRTRLHLEGPARRGRCACPRCGHANPYPVAGNGPPRHRLFAIEYHCPSCKPGHDGRFFKQPDDRDQERVAACEARWRDLAPRFVPSESIPPGDETDRLHRWGYAHYRDLFNPRQLLGLELSARLIAAVEDERVRHALATNLSDLLRYQNMLCRYDTMALKSLDVFSIHGFPVGHVACESNLLGITGRSGANVGSGGWANIVEKYTKAKRYCDAPFEVEQRGRRKVPVPIPGEWIGERRNGSGEVPSRRVTLRCGSSTGLDLPPGSLDAVFTDPPYFGNVQYGELMDFCYVWLRRLVGKEALGFDRPSTRDADELTGNATMARDLAHFAEGLAAVFRRLAQALKPGAPLAFTYHHNRQEAYAAVGVAILDAGLACTASLPCPAEMGGSIHIHGTGSSIVDTVFVCRGTGRKRRPWLFADAAGLVAILEEDLAQLRAAGLKPSAGDVRCIAYGHLTRMAVWQLRPAWQVEEPMPAKLSRFLAAMNSLALLSDVVARLGTAAPESRAPIVRFEQPFHPASLEQDARF